MKQKPDDKMKWYRANKVDDAPKPISTFLFARGPHDSPERHIIRGN